MLRTSRRKRGFTLIELLVVIAIIAILAAILFPVFAQARDKARAASCLSNCKQIATAMQVYAQDYDETLPTWNFALAAGLAVWDRPEYYWDAALLPYVKSGNPSLSQHGGVWHCPSAATGNNVRSYGYSQALMRAWMASPAFYRYPKLAEIEEPAATIFVGDGGREGRLAVPWFVQAWWERNFGKVEPTREHSYRHQEGANYTFCDSHAKWMRWEEVFPGTDNGRWPPGGLKKAYAACAKWHGATAAERAECRRLAAP